LFDPSIDVAPPFDRTSQNAKYAEQ